MTKANTALVTNIINHIVFVLDASGSMSHHQRKLVEVADAQVRHLASRSQENDQETRVTIYVFSDSNDIRCLVWDKDVLRLPSISNLYRIGGQTAFIDAAMQSFADMATTSQIHGNHSFLYYFLTDGYENASRRFRREDLALALATQANNVTVAALVPGPNEMHEAKKLGFPAGNVKIWDASTTEGLEKAHQEILRSADKYMQDRASGMTSTTGLFFDMSATAVNKATIQAAGLTPLDSNEYILTTVVFGRDFQDGDDWISNYTPKALGHQYVAGRGYYQLTLAPVKVQVQKDIAIVEKKSGKVYTGKNARALLGLRDQTETLRAGQNPDYDIFIQSTSSNRKLLVGQKYLYLTPNITYTRGQSAVLAPKKTVPKVAKMPLSPKTIARRAVANGNSSAKAPVDLAAPVYPKGGKALWAGRACPACPSKKTQRCQRPDGTFMEKPHEQRKS